jgi:hypothetical protein
MIYCKADKKAMPASVLGDGVDFEIDMDFVSPQSFKCVRNTTARFRCVFRSTVGYGIWKDRVSLV